ncbi:hypothetical protein AYO21_00228 [Fonsecaea monophora]|uniref:Uncharacterized protein n=1 Tax=Fonsecaea monophora TaxID=254056 RepID=A0A177FQE6_9EURO|nr:hypothetical protein AYO21_00228 [Fonsecaea monophora]OAG45592.1 hypothetical protein AYO21_00228 [Fonsecaea monophora]
MIGAATDFGHTTALDMANKGWKVVIANINKLKGSWEAQYSAFKMTFDKYGWLDFVQPPDLNSTVVNFIGSTYTVLLAMKYFHKNPMVGGDLIMTASVAGLYPTPVMPFSCGGKHGVVGFGRAMGGSPVKEGMLVNVLVPEWFQPQ